MQQSGGKDSTPQPEDRTRAPKGSNTLALSQCYEVLHNPPPLPLIEKQNRKEEAVSENVTVTK